MLDSKRQGCIPDRRVGGPKRAHVAGTGSLKLGLMGLVAASFCLAGCGQNFQSDRGTSAPAPEGLRPLPAIYKTAKAVAYSAYRSGGPNAGELPSDASILQDLALLNTAGYQLLRLFGSDAVSTAVLRVAAANYPNLRFQLGMFLRGAPASCSDTVNSAQMANAIALAKQYSSSVVTLSVGNETSFANNLPVNCLADYIKNVRSQVTQPVTADDDYTFFAGRTASGEKPDSILPLLDFVSIHIYAISNSGQWDWQQLATPAGPARATAMMNASLAYTQARFAEVAAYRFTTAAGASVTTGAALPIIIGEIGWKAVQTNSSSAIEVNGAHPVNAKEFLDLLNSWKGPAGGAPESVFYFEAFDEAWKGNDDGWGLWDSARRARYALCGTPAGPACNADIYQGAGYYTPSGGGGAAPATAPAAPTLAASSVVSLLSKTYAGTSAARTVDSWAAPWSGNVTETDVTIAGDAMKQYAFSAANGYAGIFFGDGEVTTTNFVDATGKTRFHMDVWMSAAADFTIQLVNDAQNAGSKTVGHYDAGTPATGTWVALDIPLSSFTGLGGQNLLEQMILQPTNAATTVYVDNVYFH